MLHILSKVSFPLSRRYLRIRDFGSTAAAAAAVIVHRVLGTEVASPYSSHAVEDSHASFSAFEILSRRPCSPLLPHCSPSRKAKPPFLLLPPLRAVANCPMR